MEDWNEIVKESKRGLVDHVKCFRNLTLNYYESKSEQELVPIYIHNMVNNQRVFLENYGIPILVFF